MLLLGLGLRSLPPLLVLLVLLLRHGVVILAVMG